MNNARIIARTLLLSATLLVFTACSTVRLAYTQAPQMTYWWLDGFSDFTAVQAPVVKQDIERFLDWHRNRELPAYAVLLQHWQTLVTQDITPAQACTQFEAVRSALMRSSEKSLEPLTRVALTMSPDQLLTLQKKQATSIDKFDKEYLRGSAEKRLESRLAKAQERAEKLYGRLTPPQRERLRRDLQISPFDAQKTRLERLRSHSDMRQTIAALQSAHPGATADAQAPAAALDLSRQFIERFQHSPLPGYKAYSDSLVNQACDTFATLHNSTSAQQRQQALKVLKGYEEDVRVLASQP